MGCGKMCVIAGVRGRDMGSGPGIMSDRKKGGSFGSGTRTGAQASWGTARGFCRQHLSITTQPMIDALLVALLVAAAVASAFLASPLSSFTLLVTACGIVLTWRIGSANRRLAERKLFLDLMPRRAEWYDRVRAALDGRAVERMEHIDAILAGGVPPRSPHLSQLWQLETEAGWLFSTEMVALMASLIDADNQVAMAHLAARDGDRHAALAVPQRWTDLTAAQDRVQDYLSSYLYVGDIGKPGRAPIKFVKVDGVLKRLGRARER